MEPYWLTIGAFVLGLFVGAYVGTVLEFHNPMKHSIPPSEPLDTQTRMNKLASKKVGVSASQTLKSIQRQLRQTKNVSDEIGSIHSAKK